MYWQAPIGGPILKYLDMDLTLEDQFVSQVSSSLQAFTHSLFITVISIIEMDGVNHPSAFFSNIYI